MKLLIRIAEVMQSKTEKERMEIIANVLQGKDPIDTNQEIRFILAEMERDG
jgi:ATP-dependent DNA ligase